MIEWINNLEAQMIEWFVNSAYQPGIVYSTSALLMIATCFGLPLPEEFIIIALGLTAHIGLRPDLYPPPEGVTSHVSLPLAILAGWGSVIIGDSIVFGVGRYVGTHPGRRKWVEKILPPEKFSSVSSWMKKYGYWTAGFFRFAPGLRLPGHFSCGMFGVSPIRFLLVDGTAATISIPTQIILISYYGDTIIDFVSKMKFFILGLASAILLFVIVWSFYVRRKKRLAALRTQEIPAQPSHKARQ